MNLADPPQPPSHPPAAAAHLPLQPGATLESFEVEQVLGVTRTGMLYRARHTHDGSHVVIKEYLPGKHAHRSRLGQVQPLGREHSAAFDRGLQAFLTEALTLSQFDHPCLLRVCSVWEADGTAYRAMPCLPGKTLLAQRLNTHAPATQAQLQRLLDGVLGALHTLQQNGLAHGQIEPRNIIVLDDDQPVLMDFDATPLALASDLKTPHVDAYANPAKIEGLATDDLHALAATLHFAVSGDWRGPHDPMLGEPRLPLAEVLLYYKDRAPVLGYRPEFLDAIDALLALPASERPGTITEMRACFERGDPPTPDSDPDALTPEASAPAASAHPAPHAAEPAVTPAQNALAVARAFAPAPPREPRNATESVLALLANFERPSAAAEDVEPFEAPVLTQPLATTTPLRSQPAASSQPPSVPAWPSTESSALPGQESPGSPAIGSPLSVTDPQPDETHDSVTPTPPARVQRQKWRRRLIVSSMVAAVLGSIGLLGWQLLG